MLGSLLDSTRDALGDLIGRHGPPVAASPDSFAPRDYSIHFFLQIAVILLTCRVVGWLGR